MKNRFRSYAMWISIAALIGIILTNTGVFQRYGITMDSYNEIVNAVLGIFVLLGIVNNPTTENKGFKDDSLSTNSKVIDGSGIITNSNSIDTSMREATTKPINTNAPGLTGHGKDSIN